MELKSENLELKRESKHWRRVENLKTKEVEPKAKEITASSGPHGETAPEPPVPRRQVSWSLVQLSSCHWDFTSERESTAQKSSLIQPVCLCS